MKFKLQIVAVTIAILACGFTAGYSWRGEVNTEAAHVEFVAGQRDVAAYVEGCTLQRAHAGECAIPCGGEVDCVEKNGTRDGY